MKCKNCGVEFEGNFCPNCGTPAATEQNAVIVAAPDPAMPRITLTFSKSTSKNYPLAVERAMKFPTYSERINGKEVVHCVDFTFDQVEEIRSLLDLVGQWKSTALYVNGQLRPYKEISSVIYCYAERERAYNPKDYCFGRDDVHEYNDNDLGCRHCGVNPYDWHGLQEFGVMQRNGTFVIDKNKLIYTVSRNLEPYMLCPALDVDAIRKRLEEIPERINPKTDPRWEYVTEWVDGKEVAIAVRKKSPRKGQGYVIKDYSQLSKDDDYDIGAVKVEPVKERTLKTTTAQTSGCGCLGCLLPILGILSVLVLAFMF
ncbi:MAG: hypothetical protein GX766_08840 [Firmicutes bacterium]|jgi:RNA polymerase subunit RPABC4/transcription elongation factor Spt4|nr:hypothetical protein [Bacillota bacterium]